MPTSLTFRLASGCPGFRLALADCSGQRIVPSRADRTITNPNGLFWSYATSEMEFLLEPGNYAYLANAGFLRSPIHGKCTVSASPLRVELTFADLPWAGLMDPWMACDFHAHPVNSAFPENLDAMSAIEGIDLCSMQCWGSYTGYELEVPFPQRGIFKHGNAYISTDQEIEMHSPWGLWEDSTVIGLQRKLPDVQHPLAYRMNAPFYKEARKQGCKWIAYQAPTWKQFPVDVALGLVDSVNLCDNFFSLVRTSEGPWKKPTFPDNHPWQKITYGLAYHVHEAYHRILNAGFRLPATGGSAFPGGGGGGPIGMNRCFAQVNNLKKPDNCFQAMRNGNTFATNGPLLLAEIDGTPPGTFDFTPDSEKNQLSLRILCNRPLDRAEWVADGQVIAERSLARDNDATDITWETEMNLGKHQWIAARCFGPSDRTRFPEEGRISPPFLAAHSSPFYLPGPERKGDARKKAVEYFLTHLKWMEDVICGKAPQPELAKPFANRPLNEFEKNEIRKTLESARKVYLSRK